jgi:hypothetical protein
MNFYPFNHSGLVLAEGNRAVLRCGTDSAWSHKHLCGYVALPIGSVPIEWRGNYNADALQYLAVHGGFTFCEVEPKENPSHVVFGFDCAHLDDENDLDLQDPAYVMRLTQQMEDQLLAYAAQIEEWRSADRERRIAMIDVIIKSAQIKTELGFGSMISMLSGAEEFGVGKDGAAKTAEVGEQPTTAPACNGEGSDLPF